MDGFDQDFIRKVKLADAALDCDFQNADSA
jgi:hypothetical protein